MKKTAPLIPTTGKTAQPKADAPNAEDVLAAELAKLDGIIESAIGAKKTLKLFYDELLARQQYIDAQQKAA